MTMFSMAGKTPDRTLSLIYADGDTATIPESHSRFDELLQLVLSGAEDSEVRILVDLMLAVSKQISQLSERVSMRGRQVLFDGDPLRGELADVLIDLFDAGNAESLKPVVNFLEKAATNPSQKSVDDLYRWITKGDLIIHEDGDFLAYKGMQTIDGEHFSKSSGTAFVNGEEITGYIPNPDGAVVTMPRSDVNDNEAVACSTGLHAGTAYYAFDFASSVTKLVKINPRDVVSVPKDSSDQKLRVCRYVVMEEVESRRDSRLFGQTSFDFPEIRVVEDVDAAIEEARSEDIPDAGILIVPSDVFADSSVEDDEEDEDDEDLDCGPDCVVCFGPSEDLESDTALENLRQKLSGEDLEYQSAAPNEAEEEQAKADAVIRDSKGRFTKESAVKAVRNSKGQFTKQS